MPRLCQSSSITQPQLSSMAHTFWGPHLPWLCIVLHTRPKIAYGLFTNTALRRQSRKLQHVYQVTIVEIVMSQKARQLQYIKIIFSAYLKAKYVDSKDEANRICTNNYFPQKLILAKRMQTNLWLATLSVLGNTTYQAAWCHTLSKTWMFLVGMQNHIHRRILKDL